MAEVLQKGAMSKVVFSLIVLTTLLAPDSLAQGLADQLNFSRSNVGGLHLYGVSGYYSYSTYDFHSALPGSIARENTRTNTGVSATVGWQHTRGKTAFTFRYTGNYFKNLRPTGYQNMNHSMNLAMSRELGRKWSVSMSASATLMDLAQSLFEPSSLALLSQSGAAIDDLAASQSIGQFSNTQNAAILGGTSASPQSSQLLLYGNRTLTYGANASVNYAISSRWSLSFGSFAAGGSYRRGDALTGIQGYYAMPKTVGGSASISTSYSLSPRTELGAAVSETYTTNAYQRAMSTSATASFGRKMGRNWFLRAYGGGYYTRNLEPGTTTITPLQVTWGASLGFRTRAHSFLATYNRSGQDIGGSWLVGTITTANGAWSWNRPRTNWGLSAAGTRSENRNTGFATLNGWRASFTVSRRLAWNLSLNASYAYLITTGNFTGTPVETTYNSARLSLSWTPRLWRSPQSAAESDQQ